VIDTLRAGREMKAFADQYRAPIPAWNLADVLLEIAEKRLTGIFHAVCPEPTSRYQFARKVAEVFGLDAGLIVPIYMDEVEAIAPRPKVLILDTASTQRALGTRLLGFEEGIAGLRDRR
jgi:dTDP-4-dehydrorhamnose reductase